MQEKKALPAFAGKQRILQYKIQIQLNEIFFILRICFEIMISPLERGKGCVSIHYWMSFTHLAPLKRGS